ncbi:MAG TPA: hypothetical protein VJT73_05755 [Polyangiaceae bacterium]|nr:hypothetical protein [Polyangiaceae bacterium]
MNLRRSPEPDAELLALLDRETAKGAPIEAKRRVEARILRTLATAGAASSALPTTPAVTSGEPTSGASWARPWWIAASAFALGGAGGAAVHAQLTVPSVRIVYVDRVVTPIPEPAVLAAVTPDASAATSKDLAPTPSSTGSSSGDSNLGGERAIIDRARRAFGAGEYASAERALDAHARQFPVGVLREEREALAIKALLAQGRSDEGRRRAAQFRERFPQSLFGPAVDEAMKSIR